MKARKARRPAPAIAAEPTLFSTAALPVTCTGAAEKEEVLLGGTIIDGAALTVVAGGVEITTLLTTGALDIIVVWKVTVGAGATEVWTTVLETTLTIVPTSVFVRSDGTVVTAVTSAEEMAVTGMTTVALVVGGSKVEVTV